MSDDLQTPDEWEQAEREMGYGEPVPGDDTEPMTAQAARDFASTYLAGTRAMCRELICLADAARDERNRRILAENRVSALEELLRIADMTPRDRDAFLERLAEIRSLARAISHDVTSLAADLKAPDVD